MDYDRDVIMDIKKLATGLMITVIAGCGADSVNEKPESLYEVYEQSEYNDDVSGAQKIELNSRVTGHLASPSDFYDWYAFTVIAGDTITLELSGEPETDFDLYFHHNLQGQIGASEHDSSGENLAHTFNEDGYLYAVVRLYGNSPEGDYELVVKTDGVGSAGNKIEADGQTIPNLFSLGHTLYCYYRMEGGSEAVFDYESSNWYSGQCQGDYVSECKFTSRPVIEQGFSGRNRTIHLTQEAVDFLGGHEMTEQSCKQLKQENKNLTYAYTAF